MAMCEVSASTAALGFKIMVIGHKTALRWHTKSCIAFLLHVNACASWCMVSKCVELVILPSRRLSSQLQGCLSSVLVLEVSGLQAVPQQGILEGFTADLVKSFQKHWKHHIWIFKEHQEIVPQRIQSLRISAKQHSQRFAKGNTTNTRKTHKVNQGMLKHLRISRTKQWKQNKLC